jgi:hypothetical protein
MLAASIIRFMSDETASTSETSVNFYKTTLRNNPEDSHLHTRRRENLKSHCIESRLVIFNNIRNNDAIDFSPLANQ